MALNPHIVTSAGTNYSSGESFKRRGENKTECGAGRAWSYDSFEMMIAMLISAGGKGSCKKGSLNLTLHHSSFSLLTHHNRQFPPLSLSKHCQETHKMSQDKFYCCVLFVWVHPPALQCSHSPNIIGKSQL